MGITFLHSEDFVRKVQRIIDQNKVAEVEWMGEDGGQGTLQVYYYPQGEGSTRQVVVDEQGDITYFDNLDCVYQQGLAALGCFPIGVTIAGIADGIDECDDEVSDTTELDDQGLALIDLVEWNCSVCSQRFYSATNQKISPVSCPFCQSNDILPITDSESY